MLIDGILCAHSAYNIHIGIGCRAKATIAEDQATTDNASQPANQATVTPWRHDGCESNIFHIFYFSFLSCFFLLARVYFLVSCLFIFPLTFDSIQLLWCSEEVVSVKVTGMPCQHTHSNMLRFVEELWKYGSFIMAYCATVRLHFSSVRVTFNLKYLMEWVFCVVCIELRIEGG